MEEKFSWIGVLEIFLGILLALVIYKLLDAFLLKKVISNFDSSYDSSNYGDDNDEDEE